MKFDPTKPVQTRDGRPACILSTNGHYVGRPSGVKYPVIAETYGKGDTNPRLDYYTIEGLYAFPYCREPEASPKDLVNIPVKHEGWINIYDRNHLKPSRERADEISGPERIACIKIEFTEGEGLTDDK